MLYRKIPKISPGAYIFQRPFLRGLYLEGLMYGGKFHFQNRFCFVLICIREQIPCTSPWGAYIRRGNLTKGFLRYDFEGLIFGGAYTWRGLFSEFYGIQSEIKRIRARVLVSKLLHFVSLTDSFIM